MIEEKKTYEIYEILSVVAEWLQDPQNEDLYNAVEEIKHNLVVKEYMPIRQKELCLRKALIDMRADEALPYTCSVLYEIAILFDGLLGYVVNLNPDIDAFYKDGDFYDLLWLSGIIDYILGFCKEDYERLKRMADRMISFDNLKEITNGIQLTSPEQIDRLTNEFKRFTIETNPEILKSIGKILENNDPLLTEIKNNIEDMAYEQIINEDNLEN